MIKFDPVNSKEIGFKWVRRDSKLITLLRATSCLVFSVSTLSSVEEGTFSPRNPSSEALSQVVLLINNTSREQ